MLGVYNGDPLCDRVGQVLCGNGGNFKQQVSVPIYIQNRTHDASSVKKNGVTHTVCTTRDSQVHDIQEIER